MKYTVLLIGLLFGHESDRKNVLMTIDLDTAHMCYTPYLLLSLSIASLAISSYFSAGPINKKKFGIRVQLFLILAETVL
jgi:hypothetical protein